MGKFKRVLTIVVAVVMALVLVVLVVGMLLPRDHRASRTLVLKQSPQAVWDVMEDRGNEPLWRHDVANVKLVGHRSGRAVWRENYKDGNGVTLMTTESKPPTRMVRELTDLEGPFSGRWEIDITPTPTGSNVTITEIGRVSNPVYRFISKVIIGHTTFMTRYLTSLAAKFGEPAQFTD